MAKNKSDSGNGNGNGNNNKNLLLYVTAFGALLMILVYVFVFQRLTTEAEAIEVSNRTLSQRVNQLRVYYDNRYEYMEDTQVLEQLLDELLMEYPADAREEDAIMLAVQMQHNSGAEFLNINMEKGAAIHVIPTETVAAAASEKYTQEIQFHSMNAIYVNEVTYAGLKSIIQTVFDSSNRVGIQNIAYTKGDAENPRLSGHIDLVFYSVSGTGREYVAPDIVPYISGTDNIFGEIVIPEKPSSNDSETAQGGQEGEEDAAVDQEEQ
ncbi:MAG: hypothetical protein K2L18_11295 [Acetatifactor sp.]|nr:hypothetical protein [Acetatifactor sp.]